MVHEEANVSDKGVWQTVEKVLAVLICAVVITFVLDLPLTLFRVSLHNVQFIALIWAGVTVLTFLSVPASKKLAAPAVNPRWYDILLALLALALGLYIAIDYDNILRTLGIITMPQVVLGAVAILVTLESTRRVAGWPIVIIALLFVIYAKYADFAPGILAAKGLSWSRLLSQFYLGADFLFGIPLKIACMVVFVFILFGQMLFQTGGSQFITNLSLCLMGRYRGGPAKVAVIASSLFGTISGSCTANVATTGVVTIPMMKRAGYTPSYAGAVEAVASTGGQMVPPVMGAAAFVMAEFLGISYAAVCLAAIFPALLYYLGVYIQVDLRAAGSNLKGLPPEQLPSFKETIRQGWVFAIPLVVLIITLFVLFLPPGVAALYSIGAMVFISFISKSSRGAWSWNKLLEMLQKTCRSMAELIPISATAGFVLGTIAYTGLGLSLAQSVTALAGNSLILLGILTAAVSILLGMGMATTPTYILLAILAAPALIMAGVEPIMAHLFVFYFGMLAMLTPPVCISVYTAASIAKAPSMQTALRSMGLGIGGYIIPFFFLYNPGLGFIGSFGEVVLSVLTCIIIVVSLSIGIEGYFLRRLRWYERLLFVLAAISMFLPSLLARLAGLAIAAVLLAIQLRWKTQRQDEVEASEI